MDAIATTQPIAKPALPKQAVAQTTPAQKKKITPGISLAAGAVAGGVEATITVSVLCYRLKSTKC
jgi:solute carrier family 25 citrate transporter 1